MEEGGFPVSGDAAENVFRSVTEAEVSLDEMLSLACRQGKQDIVELLLESGANVNHRNKAGNTPLLEACSQGHVSIARLLLDRNADIDAPTETTYDSALTWACTLGNEEIVQLLLERTACVEHRTKDGCTALMFAALAGHAKVAKLLLDHNAQINVESDSNKDSPLTFACWKGHQKVVELFLERKADIEHRTKEGFSPLMFAALGGHTLVAELLLKHNAQVNVPSGSNNDIPLTSACWKGHHQVVYLLLQFNSNIEHRTKDGCTPLMLAAREGHLTVARLLLEHGAKVNTPSGSENNVPLTLACWKGHKDVVELLLKNDSNIEHQNKAGCTPLMLAAREGHYEATQLLLDSGAQINVPSGSNDDTPLTLACWKGHESVVQLLVDRNSNVNHQTKTGCTPLMEATREGHVGVARLLLEAGADVETPDNYGQTPFFMACWKGHADVAALLLEYDANKDCRTKTGITPLFQACRENHVEVVKLLLDYGCNPSTPFPNSRECPLTLAAEKGYADLAQLLLSRCANIESRTKKGCSPFFLACKEGFREIAIMLAKHGSDIEATDHRGLTPLLSTFRNGHTELVDWLLGHVTHLPSDLECQKALMAPTPPDTDLLPQRSKCLEMIMKAKKAREQAALRNAQSLFDELDAEKEKRENKKKAAAKKRNKRKERKRKEQAEKMEAMGEGEEGEEGEDGDESSPVEGREELDGESPLLIPPHPPSPQDATPSSERPAHPPPAPDDPSAAAAPQKKKRSKRKKRKKGAEEETPPAPPTSPTAISALGESSDSADDLEYHDAQSELPDFSVPEPELSQPQAAVPSTVNWEESVAITSKEKPSISPKKSKVDTLPEKEESLRTTCEKSHKVEKVKPELEKRKVNRAKKEDNLRQVPVSRGQKARTRTEKSHSSPDVTSAAPAKLIEAVASDQKVHQSLPNSKLKSLKSSPAKPLRESSNQEQSSKGSVSSKQGVEHSPSVRGARSPSSEKQVDDGGWIKATSRTHPHVHNQERSASASPVPQGAHVTSHMILKTNQVRSLLTGPKSRQESVWVSSQESTSDWGSEEMDLDDLQVISSCRTDDDKIRSQKLREAAAAQATCPVTRPTATTASPTPPTTTSLSSTSTLSYTSTFTASSSTTTTTSHSWHEVTRTTRTVQLTVSNTLVGRIIGRGGSKINSIQEASGAHINVSRNIPKSTERLITIRGTQRSITKAQELIDEALSTPDRDNLDIVIPSPPALDVSKLDAPIPATRSTLPSTRPKKRYSDVIPPSSSQLKVTSTAPTATPTYTSTSTAPRPQNFIHPTPDRSPLPNRRISQPVISSSHPTTVSESSKYVQTDVPPTARNSGCNIDVEESLSFPALARFGAVREGKAVNPWGKPGERVTSTAAATSSQYSSSSSRAESLSQEDLERSLSAMLPSLEDSDELSPEGPNSVGCLHSSITPEPGMSASNDFQPLSKHSRSKSDPQVSSEQECESPLGRGGNKIPLSYLSRSQHFSPSLLSLPSENKTTPSASSSLGSGKVKEGPGQAGGEGHRSPQHTASVQSSNSPATSLSSVTKATKNIAVIQPTQLLHASLPSTNPLPVATQASSTLDTPTSVPTHNYGAIGPPPNSRRSSVPATAIGPVGAPSSRKTSWAGLQWSAGRLRPMSSLPTSLENTTEFDPFSPSSSLSPPPHTPSSNVWKLSHPHHNHSVPPHWLPSIQEGEKTRSFSWAGQHPFAAPGTMLPPHPHVAYPTKPHAEDVLAHPGTPDTPQGENLPPGDLWSDKDFPTPAGAYGAIGTNPPSVCGPSPTIKHHPPGDFPNSPHHPPWSSLPGASHADVWAQPFMSYPSCLATPGFQPLPPHNIGSAIKPLGNVPPSSSSSSSSHVFHRAVGQKVGTNLDPSIHHPPVGFSEESPAPIPPNSIHHKRWSVPSFMYVPPPSFQPNLVHQPDSQSWNPSYVHVHQAGTEGDPRKLPSGILLPSSNPWSQWPPQSGFTSHFSSSNAASWHPSNSAPVQPYQQEFVSAGPSLAAKVWSGVPQQDSSAELQQLMKNLDIAEHLPVLKERKLSLQQLHSMSDEEWRSLKLPVGPRVKLMNAVSNLPRSGSKGVSQGPSDPSPPQSFSAAPPMTPQADGSFLQGTF